ncbi:MAG: hypothetical protein PHU30_06270 [Oscillospiraceae bacterium]|nr:hypothetical protein [Oscillospiraceae bacterium]
MEEEKRMIENYEVRHSIFLGNREIVFGIDKNAPLPYLVSDCTDMGGFGLLRYDNAVAGDDYLEQMQEFTKRIDRQIQQVRDERAQRGIDPEPLTIEHCVPNGMAENLEGKVIVIKASSLRPEYATADHQLMLATGGNGCRPDARGRAVFCTSLYTGKQGRWERYDVQGVADVTKLPQWAQDAAQKLQRKKSREEPER